MVIFHSDVKLPEGMPSGFVPVELPMVQYTSFAALGWPEMNADDMMHAFSLGMGAPNQLG